ncbi:MAG: sensor histidine kinase [Nonomuraea sp.]|nr:sensor histidine kinase [Nonomuraea sp.]
MTLLVIPLISLVALWGFAASTTFGEALKLLKVETIWTGVINNADSLIGRLQDERLASAERVAGVMSEPGALATARVNADKARKKLSDEALAERTQSALTPEMNARLQEAFEAIGRLPEIRRQVDQGKLDPSELVESYSAVADAVHRMYSSFAVSTDVDLFQQARGLIAADEVRELLSREHALVIAADGKPSMMDMHMLARMDGARQYLMPRALGDLDPELRAPFARLTASQRYASTERMLQSYIGGEKVDLQLWRGTADPTLKEYTQAVWSAGDKLLGRMEPAGMSIIIRAGVAGLLGLIAVVFSVIVSIRVGRRITRELATLRRSAFDLAEIRLPDVVSKLRRGDEVDIEEEAPPIVVSSGATSEVADLASAFDSVQRTAVDAAVEQARLRQGVSEALRNLARRSQTLLQRQLKLLDEMQRQTEEPEALERLFRLDHLTTRMRRHAEGLVLLSGGQAGRRWRGTIPVEDVLNGAAAQVEEYTRVRVYPMPECAVSGAAVADLMHLFAELMENGAAFSSPGNEVSVRGELVGRGFAVEIEDRGLGMSDADRDAANARLTGPQEFDPARTERLGFAVVGMLAARHGIKVTLKPSPYGGTTAIVLIPATLVLAVTPTEVSISVIRTDTTGPGELPRRTRAAAKRSPEQQEPSGLPRRVRQANLPTRLKETPPQEDRPEERSPEEARALLSSLQSGWQRGRHDGDQDGGPQS